MRATTFDDSEGEVYQTAAARLRILSQSPDQAIAISDSTVPAGFPGVVKHRHDRMTDIFYVLEGELTFELGEEIRILGPGGFVLVPPGVAHTLAKYGRTPARFLSIFQAPGLEHYLKDAFRLMAEGRPWSPEEMAQVASDYHFEPVGE